MNEMPTMMQATYGSAIQSYEDGMWRSKPFKPFAPNKFPDSDFIKQMMAQKKPDSTIANKEDESMSDRRLVRVLVVDPHEDVPVDSALLYDSKEIFTDKTDQELYFDVPIAKLLEEHNATRTKIIDKSVKERTEHLEPARIRDLNMLVITVAEF